MSRRSLDRAYRQTAYVIHGVCGLMFVYFALKMLIEEQCDVMLFSYCMHGQPSESFDRLSAAIVTTAILLIPAHLLMLLRRIPLSMKAIVWLPSFYCLGAITSLWGVTGIGITDMYVIVCGVIIAICFFVYAMTHPDVRYPGRRRAILPVVVPNLLVIFLSMLTCRFIGNSDIELHEKLEVARMIRDGRLEDVYASPIRMEYFTEQLMQPSDLVGETMRVPGSVYRFLGYAPEDADMSLEHFVRHAISLEQKNDTISGRPTVRMTRLKSFYSNVFSVPQ